MPQNHSGPPPPGIRRRHYPQLDGLRGVAILAVIVGHVMEWTFLSPSAWWPGFAECGVLLFFVLSGFLITDILLREQATTGRIDLPAFYLRRALRLLPALVALVGTVAVLKLTGLIQKETWFSVLAALFYVRNIFGHGPALGHLWSLSLEEQFYLTWPVAFAWLARRRTQAVVAVLVGMALWRLVAVHWRLTGISDGFFYQRPWFRYDSILYGCFLAILLQQRPALWRSRAARICCHPLILLPVLIGVTALGPGSALYGARLTLQSMVMTGLLLFVLGAQPGTPLFAALASRFMRFMGRISYALYLWQGPLVELPSPYFGEGAWARLWPFPRGLVAALLVATGSYVFIERPFLDLKERLSARRSTRAR